MDDKIKQLTRKSNVLRETFKNLDRVLIGGALGSLGGLLAGSPEIAVSGAAAGAALRPVYDSLARFRRAGEPSQSFPRSGPAEFPMPTVEQGVPLSI